MNTETPHAHVLRIDPQDAEGFRAKSERLFAEALQYSFRFPGAMRLDALRMNLRRWQAEATWKPSLRSWFVPRALLCALWFRLLLCHGSDRKALYTRSQLLFATVLKVGAIYPPWMPIERLMVPLKALRELGLREEATATTAAPVIPLREGTT